MCAEQLEGMKIKNKTVSAKVKVFNSNTNLSYCVLKIAMFCLAFSINIICCAQSNEQLTEDIFVDSLHIPFIYNILFEKDICYMEIKQKLNVKKRRNTTYTFDSLKTFEIVTNKKSYCTDNVRFFMLNGKKYNISKLYKKNSWAGYERHIPIFLSNAYFFYFENKKYLYLTTSYYSNLSFYSIQNGSFLFDVTDKLNIVYIPITFPHNGDSPICFGGFSNQKGLYFIALSGCDLVLYELKQDKFVISEKGNIKIQCAELSTSPYVEYSYWIDIKNSNWLFDLAIIGRN